MSGQIMPATNGVLLSGGQSAFDYRTELDSIAFGSQLARDIDLRLPFGCLLLTRNDRKRLTAVDEPALHRMLRSWVAVCLNIPAARGVREFGWGMLVAERVVSREKT